MKLSKTTQKVYDFIKAYIEENGYSPKYEEIGDAVRYIGKDLAALHVHDNKGDRDAHLLPGEGILDFGSLATALREIGFNGAFSYETHVHGDYTPDEQDARERALSDFGRRLISG